MQEPTPEASPTGSSPADASTTGTPVHDPTDGPAFAKPSGEWDLVFTHLRVAEHEGFDRIVLEFTGTGVPGWSVQYVDKAALDGSGEVVRLGGDAILDIYASGATWPGAGYYSGPRRFEPENGGDVAEVYVGGTFEGSQQVLAGVEGDPAPFRVFALTDPSRLVIDALDSGD